MASVRLFALTNAQGTAMAETGLCGDCKRDPENVTTAIEDAKVAGDWVNLDGAVFVDVSANPDIVCTVCGAAQASEDR